MIHVVSFDPGPGSIQGGADPPAAEWGLGGDCWLVPRLEREDWDKEEEGDSAGTTG